MKASRIQSWFIFTKSILITGYYSLLLIIKSFSRTSARDYISNKLNEWADILLRTAKVQVRVFNPHNTYPEPGRVTIIMCNHASLYDIPLSYKVFPKYAIRMLGKKELGNIPLMGRAMKASEFPLINRKNKKQAMDDLVIVKKLMENGIVMWIFPEGTRSQDGHLAPLKKGAFVIAIETQATIIPVGIRGAHNILPARTLELNLNQSAEIHVGKPIDTKGYTLKQRQELVDVVHQAIKVLVGEEKEDKKPKANAPHPHE